MKKLITICEVVGLLLIRGSAAEAGPMLFGVDSAAQEIAYFDAWTGAERRRLPMPSYNAYPAVDTEIGLAGSKNYELYFVNGNVSDADVYVLDSLTGAVESTVTLTGGWDIDGLGYESVGTGYLYTTGCVETDVHRYDAAGGGPTFYWSGLTGFYDAVGGDDNGRIFAIREEAGYIVELDPLDINYHRQMSTSLSGIVGMAYDGQYLYASTAHNVYTLNPDTGAVLNTLATNYSLYGLAVAPVIPAPGAILLSGIGVGLVGWLRRRRTL